MEGGALGRRLPARATRWLLRAAVLAWVCFIWSRSLFDGPASSSQSDAVAALLAPAFEALGVRDVSMRTLLVRKAGHFLEYLVLGALLALTREEGAGHLWPRALLGVFAPCVDESIQLHVPGRSGQLSDVALDCCGVACGMALVRGIRSALPRCRR